MVVAESFDDVVNDPGKDVLIQFYSLSCPHCKKLEPVYRELADKVGTQLLYSPHALPVFTQHASGADF